MQTPKEFYKTYQADDSFSELSEKICKLIAQEGAVHAFEFGMGSGKHLRRLRSKGICTFGMDISILNCIRAQSEMLNVALGDESNLRHLVNFDCVFTVSVLDHIENVSEIIGEFKRICNKAVFIAETNDIGGPHYFPHEYESYGFRLLNFEWHSEADGCDYHIWQWRKEWTIMEYSATSDPAHDDLG